MSFEVVGDDMIQMRCKITATSRSRRISESNRSRDQKQRQMLCNKPQICVTHSYNELQEHHIL